MKNDFISIVNACEHNLKSVSVNIPRNKFIVITGPSGSGKSSLAFDTLYNESQRRYIESLSSYARQFIGVFQPPNVEAITGLSPSIAINQKTTGRNPRSTVGTITEIYDYLRILYAKIGTTYCPKCGKVIKGQSPQQIVNSILLYPANTKIQILAPVVKNAKGTHKEEIRKFLNMGFTRARINGELTTLSEEIELTKTKQHSIDIVIDRIVVKNDITQRLTDSIELALKQADGYLTILKDDEELMFSEHHSCSTCNISFPDVEPRLFSFNSPLGACAECNGLGESKMFQLDLMILDEKLSINEGAIGPLSKKSTFLYQMIYCMAKAEKVNLDLPFNKLPDSFKRVLLEGSDKIYTYSFKSENSNFNFKKAFPGIIQWLNKKYNETSSDSTRENLESFMRITKCKACSGQRLNPFALSTRIGGKSIMDLCSLSIENADLFFKNLSLDEEKKLISKKLFIEIKSRINFLLNVGLTYLTLNRSAGTLSGGESQRIRLATQIGSALSGILYILDEPSIGLHPRDNTKLILTLKSLRELGNTVLVVEHDEETMESADLIIDMGPAAGTHGGEITAIGTYEEICKNKKSLTGKYLSKTMSVDIPASRRKLKDFIKLKGATENNLSNLNLSIPLGGMIALTGVSGSGKSTLVHRVLVPAIKAHLAKDPSIKNNNFSSISGLEKIDSLIELDQSPIGRTPKSNPATYTGVFDDIRNLFSATTEAKVRGYKPGRFSFNVKGGRCEECEGNGIKRIEMHFLPDVFITCNECKGRRYNSETLSIYFKGKNISDVLEMTAFESIKFFENQPKIHRVLQTLNDVGLGYIKLGQSATTLSGGESQRMKLASELCKKPKGHCFYFLDEPTTGLHFNDIKILLYAIQKLVDQGNSVLIIEHNLDVIKTADYIIDMGPDGGDKGGQVIAEGTPEELVSTRKKTESYTGDYLFKALS